MSILPRFGTTLSAIALGAMLTGCAAPLSLSGTGSAAKLHKSDVGLATRAQLALNAGDFATAIELGERAVERSADDALIRSVLGNAYFGAGRFASAEAAYRDSLTLASNQPQVVLKLALVEIAQGKNGEAIAFLEAARGVLDPADYGLALALAGQPQQAVQALEPAARAAGADARVRQNLALAYGLAGNWEAARVIASQDLAANLVDARVQQWMALAQPTRASDQVAALVGVTPAAVDPGQPIRLALNKTDTRLAQAAPAVPAPALQSFAPQQVAALAALPQLQSVQVQAAEAVPAAPPPISAYVPPAGIETASVSVPPAVTPAKADVVEDAPPQPEFSAPAAPAAPVALAASKPRKAEPVRTKQKASGRPQVRQAAMARASGKAGVVVQLGAYSNPSRVSDAWDLFAGRFKALRNYTPTSARFNGAGKPVYRLSVKGFDSVGEAKELCVSLRKHGKNCFVRSVAGDAPVRMASR